MNSLLLVGILVPYWLACIVYCFRVIGEEDIQGNVLQTMAIIPFATLMAPMFFIQKRAMKRSG